MLKYLDSVFLVVFILFCSLVSAEAAEVSVIPDEVYPGDAFMIVVRSEEYPWGRFMDRAITFYPVKGNTYISLCSVPYDTKPGTEKVMVRAGETLVKDLWVRKASPVVIPITLPEEKVALSPEDLERVKKENLRLSGIWSGIGAPLWEGSFKRPLNSGISTRFGTIRVINGKRRSLHKGTDYRGRMGIPVVSIGSGKVSLTDNLFFGGNTVIIDHGGGMYSIYMHLSGFNVHKGQTVKRDEIIGFVGSTGRATGPHLHLSVKIRGLSVNPESLFRLPLDEIRQGRNP